MNPVKRPSQRFYLDEDGVGRFMKEDPEPRGHAGSSATPREQHTSTPLAKAQIIGADERGQRRLSLYDRLDANQDGEVTHEEVIAGMATTSYSKGEIISGLAVEEEQQREYARHAAEEAAKRRLEAEQSQAAEEAGQLTLAKAHADLAKAQAEANMRSSEAQRRRAEAEQARCAAASESEKIDKIAHAKDLVEQTPDAHLREQKAREREATRKKKAEEARLAAVKARIQQGNAEEARRQFDAAHKLHVEAKEAELKAEYDAMVRKATERHTATRASWHSKFFATTCYAAADAHLAAATPSPAGASTAAAAAAAAFALEDHPEHHQQLEKHNDRHEAELAKVTAAHGSTIETLHQERAELQRLHDEQGARIQQLEAAMAAAAAGSKPRTVSSRLPFGGGVSPARNAALPSVATAISAKSAAAEPAPSAQAAAKAKAMAAAKVKASRSSGSGGGSGGGLFSMLRKSSNAAGGAAHSPHSPGQSGAGTDVLSPVLASFIRAPPSANQSLNRKFAILTELRTRASGAPFAERIASLVTDAEAATARGKATRAAKLRNDLANAKDADAKAREVARREFAKMLPAVVSEYSALLQGQVAPGQSAGDATLAEMERLDTILW